MATNNTLAVSELDFEGISSELVSFLQNYPQFKDYDFEGSNLRTLIDLLSYNTYLNSFYTNMAINEMFLDTAVVRDSVISHAKTLNYLPRSARSAEAKIDITIFPEDSPAYVTIPAGTTFNGTDGQKVYGFLTDKDIIIIPVNNVYSANAVSVYEGVSVSEVYTVNSSMQDQRFILSNPNIDVNSLSVQVTNSLGNYEEWTYSTSVLGLKTTSKAYFLQATSNKYEIIFGDDIISAAPANGAKILATYRVCSGEAANGIKRFKSNSTLGGYSNFSVTTSTSSNGSIISALGGSQPESTQSIKLTAPRSFQSLDRAVTIDDYKTILFAKYPEIRTLHVYGGDEVSPPQYGKVFIVVDIENAVGLSEVEAQKIQSYISTKTPISITPLVVGADYTYAAVTTSAQYNLNTSGLAESDIKAKILTAITTYNDTYLNDFNSALRYSKLVAAIDSVDDAITSNETSLKIFKKISPTLNTDYSTSLKYQNQLIPGTISSTSFTYRSALGSFIDNGAGKLQIATTINNILTAVYDIGTIDYTTGTINIINLNISEYLGNGINIYADTVQFDFSSKQNTILRIDPNNITISVTGIRT